jgi:predicted lactoylglutathione lyase
MIGYVTLGTNDLANASRFYDELLGEIGAKRMLETDRFIIWSASPDRPAICLTKPFNGEPATIGNGMMVALAMKEPAQVDRLHQKALELGGSCEGKPGPRPGGFYVGYFRDTEGNKLNAFCMA